MRSRVARTTVLVLLLALGIGAAVEAWGVQRRLDALDSDHRELANRLERIESAIAFTSAAQHTYTGSGQPDELTLNRVSVLVQQIATDTADVRTRIRAAHSPSHLQSFADGLAGLIDADTRAREQLAQGQSLAAAEAVLRESRESVAGMDAKLRELSYAEDAAFDAGAARLIERRQWIIGGVGLVWALGLIAFAPMPRPRAIPASPAASSPVDELPLRLPEPAMGSPEATGIDLKAVADLCVAISRVSEEGALRDLLARAATMLDATGVIVWMGAGDELFPAAAYGYEATTLDRLGPIGRAADNATAQAWRTGELRVVRGSRDSHGAIVVPLWGAKACTGVLAAEVRHGREHDTATQAVTSMIAAQLATVLPAWPAASTSDGGKSERHAAAS